MSFYWKPYVPVAERRRQAAAKAQKMAKQGRVLVPVHPMGRTIATTFWGKAWNDNLEAYSDYDNRLSRGRTYVRNGSVIDLQIAPGEVRALVSGSDIYEVAVKVAPIPKAAWQELCQDCVGGIASMVELLQGRLSKGVMERICRQKTGLFPTPRDIHFACSCPDWASMCKHVAAVLYAIGARLDHDPDLLFTLRAVNAVDLLAAAGSSTSLIPASPDVDKVLDDTGLADLFDLEMADAPVKPHPARPTVSKAAPPKRSAPPKPDTPKAAAPAKRASSGSSKTPAAAPASAVSVPKTETARKPTGSKAAAPKRSTPPKPDTPKAKSPAHPSIATTRAKGKARKPA